MAASHWLISPTEGVVRPPSDHILGEIPLTFQKVSLLGPTLISQSKMGREEGKIWGREIQTCPLRRVRDLRAADALGDLQVGRVLSEAFELALWSVQGL